MLREGRKSAHFALVHHRADVGGSCTALEEESALDDTVGRRRSSGVDGEVGLESVGVGLRTGSRGVSVSRAERVSDSPAIVVPDDSEILGVESIVQDVSGWERCGGGQTCFSLRKYETRTRGLAQSHVLVAQVRRRRNERYERLSASLPMEEGGSLPPTFSGDRPESLRSSRKKDMRRSEYPRAPSRFAIVSRLSVSRALDLRELVRTQCSVASVVVVEEEDRGFRAPTRS